MNQEIEKFWSDLIIEELPVNKFVKLISKLIVPFAVRKIDDNFLEKIPSPWKEYAMQLSTSAYLAAQDKELSDEEAAGIVDLCVSILNERIDIPLLDEDDEAATFQALLKLVATLLIKRLR